MTILSKLFILFVLILCLLGIASSAKISSTTARSYEKLGILALVLIGSGMTIFPEITTTVANSLGIGRGADLVFYLFMIFMIYVLARIYLELKLLSSKLSKLAIHLALSADKNKHDKDGAV